MMTTAIRKLATILEDRLTMLLAASAIGVYLLVLVGATTSLLHANDACTTWPTCNGSLIAVSSPAMAIAWGHRVLAIVVGVLIATTAVVAWYSSGPRIGGIVAVAALLYPVQAALGALIALEGASRLLTAGHLTVAVSIFSAILLGLLWRLESRHGAPTRQPSTANQSFEDLEPRSSETAGQESYGWGTIAMAYFRMTKPRLMWLLALVAMASMGLAAGPALEAETVVWTITGGVLAVGSSGTFNQVLERDRDQYMDRTSDRPVVTDVIPPRRAIAFGVALAGLSVVVFLAFVNPLAAALGVLAILFYTVVYTMILKPHTEHNTVLGGAVGAFPALIGWAAVTNEVGMPAVVLGLVVFLWTPAHFYNLALAYKDDYARAGYPMLPVTAGEAVTRRHILGYLGATLVASVVLGTASELGWVYAVGTVAVAVVFLLAVVGLFREQTENAAFRAFHASNAYLGIVLLAIVFDTLLVA
ncbi:Polyprenyltransferase (cytochrome oxidase assembly factor) [Halanaeroarchaeum sp. HSR-CO]|uniref:heme o synthase n=1 Tax=Halanaeroarchaeum sp. HSR-CO TaxID=2866382 RepID=UPI00217F146C|nr:heme o synthase [Halanaeroarchaeum sp. HSR-CO]UWG48236.1 Polyprenyltransferase (cytochrome oxidase assembly factor) [Halanaeroarchaeum sp. HSR-CO]